MTMMNPLVATAPADVLPHTEPPAPVVQTPPQIAATPAQINALNQAEQAALANTGASKAIWGVLYILLVAGLVLLGYLITQFVSYHNTAAQSILVPIALYFAGFLTPGQKIVSAVTPK